MTIEEKAEFEPGLQEGQMEYIRSILDYSLVTDSAVSRPTTAAPATAFGLHNSLARTPCAVWAKTADDHLGRDAYQVALRNPSNRSKLEFG